MTSACACRTLGLDVDREGTDEFRVGFAVLVLKYESDDFDEVVAKLVERIGLGVGSRERRDVADILSGDETAFDDGGEGAHGRRPDRSG